MIQKKNKEIFNSPKKTISYKISPTIHCVTKQGDTELVNMKHNDVGLELSAVAHSIVSIQELKRQDTVIATTDLPTEIFNYLRENFLPIEGFSYQLNEASHEWSGKVLPFEK